MAALETAEAKPADNCAACDAASCCRQGMIIAMTRRQARRNIEAGGQVKILNKDETGDRKPGWNKVFVGLLEDCVQLDQTTGQCKIYGSDDRPAACHRVQPGSEFCHGIQDWGQRQGLQPLNSEVIQLLQIDSQLD